MNTLLAIIKRVTIPLFVLLIFLPCIWAIPGIHDINLRRFTDIERRAPNQYPELELTVAGMRTFPEQFEDAFNDHFGFRRDLISLYKLFMYKVFNISTDEGNVVVGKNGWLFLGDKYEFVFSRHAGTRPTTKQEVDAVVEAEIRKRAWLSRRGIKYLYVIAPDKHSIYPEYLPAYVLQPNKDIILDHFIRDAKRLGLPALDLRPAMFESKKRYDGDVYAVTDSHWSNVGAYDGYTAIMEQLAEQTGHLNTVPLNGYKKSIGRAYNLEGLLGFRKHYKLTDVHIALDLAHNSSDMRAEKFDGSSVKWKDTAEVHYNDKLFVKNPNSLNPQSLFILRDSFFNRLSPLFNHTFSRLAYTHYNREELNENIVPLLLRFKPDVLLCEMVERNLAGVKAVYTPWRDTRVDQIEAGRVWNSLKPVPFKPKAASGEELTLSLPGNAGTNLLLKVETNHPLEVQAITNTTSPVIATAKGWNSEREQFIELMANVPIKKLRLTSKATSGALAVDSISIRGMSETALRSLYH